MTRLVSAFAVLVAGAAGVMAWRVSVPPAVSSGKGITMQWSEVKNVVVPAKPTGAWTWAVDYVKGPARILIEAQGQWAYSPGRPGCGPDGDLEALLGASHTLLPAAPAGALLAKIGGSTAGVNDGSVRVAGSKAYFEIDAATSGPIFLTINDEPGGMSDNSGALQVTISVAALPPPSEKK
jgi:hypothetical protein